MIAVSILAPVVTGMYIHFTHIEAWSFMTLMYGINGIVAAIFSTCICIVIVLTFYRYNKVNEYKTDAGKRLMPLLTITLVVMILFTTTLIINIVAISDVVLLFNGLA